MKRIAATIACLMILMGTLNAGAQIDDNEQRAAWGPTTGGCRLSLTPEQPSYRFDQPIRLRLTLKNVGDKPVHLIGSPFSTLMQHGYRFDVRLPDGETAPLTLESKRRADVPGGSVSLTKLEPRKSVTTMIGMLNRRYDMTLLGEYTVKIYWQLAPEKSGEKPVEVPSNTLKIVVHDNEAEDDREE